MQKLADEYEVSTKSITRSINDLKAFLADHRELVGNTELQYSHQDKCYRLYMDEFLSNKELFALVEVMIGARAFSKDELLELTAKLNPFSFPDEIHVLEHIDRLIEIFNACWPMYAAMPAVLKDAIEASYESCGWSLTYSVCEPKRYPTFATLLEKLPEIMNRSDYSKDTKGDYIGALVTRVKSLTNGINGQIFCVDEGLSDEQLFDQNVIVDLSRVGSMETKSLLMGILMIKLQEHRMANASDVYLGRELL